MNDISEEEWEECISDMEYKLNELINNPPIDFQEMFDCEIILVLLKAGLKNKKDEKNKI